MKKQDSKTVDKKKLVLEKELIRILDQNELPLVAGGIWTGSDIGCCSGRIMCG